jgi:hypothetical protein
MGNATPPVKSLHPETGVAEPPKRRPSVANWRGHKIIREVEWSRAMVDFFASISLHLGGVPMDPDLNKYDLEHACTGQPLMSKQAWTQVYADAWKRYYTDEHVETIMRRGIASGMRRDKLLDLLTTFAGSVRIEGAPAAIWICSPQGAHTTPPRPADCQSASVLSVAGRRFSQSGVAMASAVFALSPHQGAGRSGSGGAELL